MKKLGCRGQVRAATCDYSRPIRPSVHPGRCMMGKLRYRVAARRYLLHGPKRSIFFRITAPRSFGIRRCDKKEVLHRGQPH